MPSWCQIPLCPSASLNDKCPALLAVYFRTFGKIGGGLAGNRIGAIEAAQSYIAKSQAYTVGMNFNQAIAFNGNKLAHRHPRSGRDNGYVTASAPTA